MKRKGAMVYAALAILSFITIIGSVGFTMDYQDIVKRKYYMETTELMADRVAADIYGLTSYPRRGQIEINLRSGKYNVSIRDKFYRTSDGDKIYTVNVSFEGANHGYSNFTTRSSTTVTNTSKPSQYVCVTKSSGTVSLESGQC